MTVCVDSELIARLRSVVNQESTIDEAVSIISEARQAYGETEKQQKCLGSLISGAQKQLFRGNLSKWEIRRLNGKRFTDE